MKKREKELELELKQLSLKFILGFPVVGCFWMILLWFFGASEALEPRIAYWIGGIGWVFGALTLLSPTIGCRILFIWKKFIVLIDAILVWTLLPLFYFSILTPFSLALRLFGKNRMGGKRKNDDTYWRKCEPAKLDRYIRQF